MRRLSGPLLGLGCVFALMLACFGRVLFNGEQFGYRDAAHYYYPLYQRVQEEWSKHRLPLWDSRENSGMPLLGNPTAAVFYPVKVIYALLPYPWAARVYTIAHVALALAGMYWLMRGWGTSRAGSGVSAISYAFGAPILFQYCNIIYLVGAAWVPFGLSAVDSWLRTGRRSALLTLAVVLAMQTLGGEPQAAYLTGLCAGGYALGLTVARRREAKGLPPARASRTVAATSGLVLLWVMAVLACAWILPMYRPMRRTPPVSLPWWPWVPPTVAVVWVVAGIVCLSMRRRGGGALATMLSGLGVAAVLAGMISAAQLLPVMEYTSKTVRAAQDGPHYVFPFSLEPFRMAEFFWPNVFGSTRAGNRAWGTLILPKDSAEIWVPSLYIGGPVIVLALSAFGLRGGGARRVWLSWIAVVGLLASLGEFGGPLWVARNIPAVASVVGDLDLQGTTTIRRDGMLRDGDGSIYGLMSILLPGFGHFRYPSKLLTFTCLGLSGLAGIGLDRLLAGRSRRAIFLTAGLLGGSIALLISVQAGRPAILATLLARSNGHVSSTFGPFDIAGAWRDLRAAIAHGSIVLGAALALFLLTRRSPRWATLGLPILLTADLAIANAPLIITVPQSVFDTMPELLFRIAEAEAKDPSPGPFRVHRMPSWEPVGWREGTTGDRYRDMVEWERKTIQPKYAISYGVSYTATFGVGELYDYEWFFSPSVGNRRREVEPPGGEKTPGPIFFPRRGFDLWNTRYFVIPAVNANTENRAITSFLRDSEPIVPTRDQLQGPGAPEFSDHWARVEDWRLLKNPRMFPRAWIVHEAEFRTPVEGLGRATRVNLMNAILYEDDPFWVEEKIAIRDLRRTAFIETNDPSSVRASLSGRDSDPSESANVVVLDDQKVEIEAVLKTPGVVILSDVYYPGWELTLDDRPATILRTNRLMRGAVVPAGTHRLVYRYHPRSVRLGMAISFLGLGAVSVLAIAFRARPRTPILSSSW